MVRLAFKIKEHFLSNFLAVNLAAPSLWLCLWGQKLPKGVKEHLRRG